jgi:glutaredoxin
MRCAVHGLAAGPDGACVVCKRGSASGASARRGQRGYWMAAATMLMALNGAALAYRGLRSEQHGPVLVVEELPADVEAEEPEPEEAPSPPELAPAPPPPVASAPALPQVMDEAQLARVVAEVPITMYTTSWCQVCRNARTFLSANGYRFVEHDIDRDASAKERMKALNPQGSVPTIDVDGTVLVGFGDGSKVAQAVAAGVERRTGVKPTVRQVN